MSAVYQLGKFYEDGKCLKTGRCLVQGECVEKKICIQKDIHKAIKLYKYSANRGNRNSQFQLAKIYEKENLVDQDLQKAEEYYQLSKTYLDREKKYDLARKYLNGNFGNSDYIKAYELFKEIADEKPHSRYNIFQTPILELLDKHMDYIKLVDMLKLISERGEKEICYSIGYLYENVEGVFQNLIKAYCLFTEASNKGHKEASKKPLPPVIRLVFIPYVIIFLVVLTN
jgi:TPR repeat protein